MPTDQKYRRKQCSNQRPQYKGGKITMRLHNYAPVSLRGKAWFVFYFGKGEIGDLLCVMLSLQGKVDYKSSISMWCEVCEKHGARMKKKIRVRGETRQGERGGAEHEQSYHNPLEKESEF